MITSKDMLTVMPVICHRKALFLVAFNAIMITLLATSCQSLTTGRTVQDMHNPRIATDKCGRQGVISSVCDPDGVILHGEANQVDMLILRVHNNTDCPCSPQMCRRAPGGYRIAVALIKSIWLDPELRHRASYPVEDIKIQAMDALLDEARRFTVGLLQNWNMGRCQEDIVILYAQDHNIIYTATNAKARELLTDSLVSEITMNWRIYFGPKKYSNAEGLLRIIGDYGAVLRGKYVRDLNIGHDHIRKAVQPSRASHIHCASFLFLCSWIHIITTLVFAC